MAYTVKNSWKVQSQADMDFVLQDASRHKTSLHFVGPVPAGLPDHDWHDGVWEPGVLHRDGRGGHGLLLHPPGHVVGGADPHLARVRRLSCADHSR